MVPPAAKTVQNMDVVSSHEVDDLQTTLAKHLHCISDELQAVEAAVQATIDATPTAVREVISHLAGAGGKRLRPALVLLWARLAGCVPASEQVIQRALCCEAVHVASLLHDDVIDSAERRRGRDSCNRRWGNKASVLAADRLLAGVFHDLTVRGDIEAMELLSYTVTQMCDAELWQTFHTCDLSLDENDCLEIACGKTGSLMAACCRLGGLSASDTHLADTATRFGEALGTAFQIADDVLDISGDEQALGKPLGQDLADGQMTLPIRYALQNATERDHAFLEALFTTHPVPPGDLERGLAVIRRAGGVDIARRKARQIVAEAKEILAPIRDSDARSALLFIADYVVARSR